VNHQNRSIEVGLPAFERFIWVTIRAAAECVQVLIVLLVQALDPPRSEIGHSENGCTKAQFPQPKIEPDDWWLTLKMPGRLLVCSTPLRNLRENRCVEPARARDTWSKPSRPGDSS